jgi:hypothetical protein
VYLATSELIGLTIREDKVMTITLDKLDTANWLEFPFQYQEMAFISKFSPSSPLLERVSNMPLEMFNKINSEALADLLGDELDRDIISKRLDEANAGATHALIVLA